MLKSRFALEKNSKLQLAPLCDDVIFEQPSRLITENMWGFSQLLFFVILSTARILAAKYY